MTVKLRTDGIVYMVEKTPGEMELFLMGNILVCLSTIVASLAGVSNAGTSKAPEKCNKGSCRLPVLSL